MTQKSRTRWHMKRREKERERKKYIIGEEEGKVERDCERAYMGEKRRRNERERGKKERPRERERERERRRIRKKQMKRETE